MSNKENGKPSLREKIRVYKSTLSSDELAEFNRVFDKQKETQSLQKAFASAKDAVEKVSKKD